MPTSHSSSAAAAELELLADIVTNAPVPIFLKDGAGVYLYVNNAFVAQSSRSRDEMLGRTDIDLHPEAIAKVHRLDDRMAMESAAPVHNLRPVLVNGEHRMFNTVKFPIHATDGQIVGVCGIAVDCTDALLQEQAREAERRRHISDKPFERLFATLTHQEERVADLLALGYADKEIAEALYLSPDTVRHHVSRVLRKLRKQSRTQAVIEMLKHRGVSTTGSKPPPPRPHTP